MMETFTTGEGIKLATHQSGGDRDVIFQHGLCGDAAQPVDVFPQGEKWNCVTLECRGHGQSEIGNFEKLSIATFTDDLANFIESRNQKPIAVGGISMGAAIAMRLAAIRPDLVKALIIARPAWGNTAAPENMKPNALVGDLLSQHEPDQALIEFEKTAIALMLATAAPDNLSSLRGFFKRMPIANTAALLQRITGDGPNINITEIKVPTLVICSERDYIHPVSHAISISQSITNSKLVKVTPKSTNLAQYKLDFRMAIQNFLTEHDL